MHLLIQCLNKKKITCFVPPYDEFIPVHYSYWIFICTCLTDMSWTRSIRFIVSLSKYDNNSAVPLLPPEDFFLGSNLQKPKSDFQIRWHFSWQKSFVGSLIKLHDNNLPLFNLGRNTIIICVRKVFIQENLTSLAIINYLQVRRITRASEQWASLGTTTTLQLQKTIAGFQCHAIQNRSKSKSKLFNTLSPESGKWTEVNIQRFAKIQARGIFRIRDIRRKVLPKFIEICMQTPCWCPPEWAPTWWTETNRNICYRILVQKREFIPQGTHKH